LILSVSAAQVPEIVLQMVREQRAESAIVIPGGLEEKQGGETLAHAMRETLTTSRTTTWQGPVINGGNCLGIRSLPGHYNTLFIPEYKLPVAKGKVAPLALVSQSGAFAISRISRITAINPKFAISVGNQMDLTIGDYLTYLKDDPELDIFAIYVEGFKRLDGLRFLKAATELRKKGKTVILYRAGRTAAGAQASASHTASMAGDYMVTRALCEQAGVILCETIDEFEDLTLAFTQLHGKKAKGWKLGAVSNAGCECVAIADNLGKFELAELSAQTHERLEKLFIKTGISQIVDVHNPLDLTPMAGDEAYEQSAHAILEDPGVHAAVIGVVPLSTALNSLAPASHHREDVSRPDSVGSRLAALKNKTEKPWVAVVDAGAIYDPLAKLLTEQGVPTFRSADRALRALNAFVKN
jgi:acyl-CoA synthetase (NDP forming)